MSRTLKLVLLLVVSAGILAGCVVAVGIPETWDAVRKVDYPPFVATGVLWAALLLLQSAAWASLNRAVEHRVPFWTLLKATTVGLAVNIITPSTYLGGEAVKVVYVGRKTGLPYQEVAGTVVLAKYIEALSFILFFAFSTLVAAVSFRDDLFDPPYLPWGVTMLVVAAALLALSVVLWLSLSRRWCPLTRLVGLLARLQIRPKFFAHLRERTRGMEEQVTRVFCEEGGKAREAFGFFVLTHVVVFFRPWVFFFLGMTLGPSRVVLRLPHLSLIFVACQAILAFQFTPSGAGTLDAGLIGTFALLGIAEPGVAEPYCMAYLLCLRFWDFVAVTIGGVLSAHVGIGFIPGKPEEAPAPEPADKQRAGDVA